MSVNLRFPNITGHSDREQLIQMKSYMHQLVEQLQWAFNSIEGTGVKEAQVVVNNVTSRPSTTINGQATFDAVKELIIKSADIVNAYYEEISQRLEGIYVAESDFGTFIQQTSQDIKNNSETTERNFTNIQEISNGLDDSIRDLKIDVEGKLNDIRVNLENINHTVVAVTANIRSGLLYYDENGTPIYGLEVGQRTMIDGVEVFDKYARFTSDKLSFYDNNDNEVAYISDRKLYINHVEVKGTFRMGGCVQTALADGSIVKRWVTEGGEG